MHSVWERNLYLRIAVFGVCSLSMLGTEGCDCGGTVAGINTDPIPCQFDIDCGSMGRCEDNICVEGARTACPSVCANPPAPECSVDDSELITYAATGSCDPAEGICRYEETRFACPTCSQNDACGSGICDNSMCPDTACGVNGVASRIDGTCRCDYSSRANGVSCLGEPGFCTDGVCGCAVDRDCDDGNGCTEDACSTTGVCENIDAPELETCGFDCPKSARFSAPNFDARTGGALLICGDFSGLGGDVELTGGTLRLTGSVGPVGVSKSAASVQQLEVRSGYLLDFFEETAR